MEVTGERIQCQVEVGARREESGMVPSRLLPQQRGSVVCRKHQRILGNGTQTCYLAAKGDPKDLMC